MVEVTLSAPEVANLLGLPTPTPQQCQFIELPLEHGLIVAGAGSGKTTTIALRISYLLANKVVLPTEILGLTFTRKAAAELEQRIRKFLHILRERKIGSPQLGYAYPTIMTYHSYAIEIIRTYGVLKGIDPQFTLIDPTQSWQISHEYVNHIGHEIDQQLSAILRSQSKWYDRSLAVITQDIIQLSQEMTEHNISSADLENYNATFQDLSAQWEQEHKKTTLKEEEQRDMLNYQTVISRLCEPIKARHIERAQLNYDQIIDIANELVHTYSYICREEQSRYATVFLDEYQDTGEGQRRFLATLFASPTHDNQQPALSETSVQAVGDPLQSIYGWRGASAMNLPRFPHDFCSLGKSTSTFYLNQSWRNSSHILELANHIAQSLRSPILPVPELIPAPHSNEGTVKVALHSDWQEELHYLMDYIKKKYAENPGCSIAVLLRRGTDFPTIVRMCEEEGISYHLSSLAGLLNVPCIREILIHLEMVDGVCSDSSVVEALIGPRWNIGAHDISMMDQFRRAQEKKISTTSRTHLHRADSSSSAEANRITNITHKYTLTLLESLMESKEEITGISSLAVERMHDLREIIERARQLAAISPTRMFDFLIKNLGIYEYYVYRANTVEGEDNAIKAFSRVFYEYVSHSETFTLKSFIEYCSLAHKYDRGLELPTNPRSQETSSAPVALMTIHASKGLEFDHVIIANMTEGIFPSTRGSSSWLSHPAQIPANLRQDINVSQEDPDAYPTITWPPHSRRDYWKDIADHKKLLTERKEKEERRLWYVACTRAKESVLLSGHNSENISSFLMESHDFLLRSQQEHNIVRWHTCSNESSSSDEPVISTSSSDTVTHWPVDVNYLLPESQKAAQEKIHDLLDDNTMGEEIFPPQLSEGDRNIVERIMASKTHSHAQSDHQQFPEQHILSVSEIINVTEHKHAHTASSGKKPMYNRQASVQGTQFHQWVVDQTYDQYPLDYQSSTIPNMSTHAVVSSGRLQRWQQNFEQSPWFLLRPYAVEQPFTLYYQGKQIRGRIDAIYRIDDVFHIVDWKTGASSHAVGQNKYYAQLALYRLAWAQLHSVNKTSIKAYLYFVDDNKHFELPVTDDNIYLSAMGFSV